MASQYFIQRGGEESGPFGFRDLVTFVREGKLVYSDPVRFSWTTEWQRADSLVGLFYMARKPPDDLSRLDALPAPAIPIEPIPALPDESADIAAVEDRPGWIMRLIDVGGFRRKKSAESSMPGPVSATSSETTAACSSLPEGSSPDPQFGGGEAAYSRTAAAHPYEEQPAEIAAFFNQGSPAQKNLWSSAFKDALASVPARGGKSAKSRPSRFRKMFSGLVRVIPRGEEGQSLLRNGFRIVCAIVCANLVAWAVDSWSAQEGLRFPSRDAQASSLHHFPVVGTCGSGEYLFLMFDLMLAAGVAAWFAAGWLESRAE